MIKRFLFQIVARIRLDDETYEYPKQSFTDMPTPAGWKITKREKRLVTGSDEQRARLYFEGLNPARKKLGQPELILPDSLYEDLALIATGSKDEVGTHSMNPIELSIELEAAGWLRSQMTFRGLEEGVSEKDQPGIIELTI